MTYFQSSLIAVFLTTAAAQSQIPAAPPVSLTPQTILPITFTANVSANHVRSGDAVVARTVQAVTLSNGQQVRRGAEVRGHVVDAQSFTFDKTPYAKQHPSALAIKFDSLMVAGQPVPLHVGLRAMADPISSWDAVKPKPSDEDPDGTLTQVGGELLKPHQGEIINMDGDVVGYSRRGGNFAHLIASDGRGVACDGSDTEQPVSIFSASACGLYGFGDSALVSSGDGASHATLAMVSRRSAPQIYKNSSALLEVLPETGSSLSTR